MTVTTYRTGAQSVALHGASTKRVTEEAAAVIDQMNRNGATDEEIVAYVNGLPIRLLTCVPISPTRGVIPAALSNRSGGSHELAHPHHGLR